MMMVLWARSHYMHNGIPRGPAYPSCWSVPASMEVPMYVSAQVCGCFRVRRIRQVGVSRTRPGATLHSCCVSPHTLAIARGNSIIPR